MAVIIGDIHGDVEMVRAFLEYKPEAEHVALGDLVDSRDSKTTFEEELACLELLLESDAVLIWGNHDLAYTPEQPWALHKHNGFVSLPDRWLVADPYLTSLHEEFGVLKYRDIFEARYHPARSRGQIKAAHGVGGWLCTHAGASSSLAAALPDCPWDTGEASLIADWLNAEFDREMATRRKKRGVDSEGPFGEGPLFYMGRMRGGGDPFGGIFWYDPRWEPSNPPDPRVRQVFGHTLVEGPMIKKSWVNVHIEGGYWICQLTITMLVLNILMWCVMMDRILTKSGNV